MQNLIKKYGLLWLILAVAAFLRFFPGKDYQFSHDELSALSRTIFPDLQQTLLYGVMYTDTHPVLIQVFLYYWVKLGGVGELWVKLPFLICGWLTVFYLYRLGCRSWGEQAGLFAALLSAASLLFVYYSTQARLYAPGTLFGLFLLNNALCLIGKEPVNKWRYLRFALWALLCALTNHLCCLYALTVGVATLLFLPRERRWHFLLTALITLLLYLPHLPITLVQLGLGGLDEWLPKPQPGVWLEFLYALGGTGLGAYTVGGFLLLAVFFMLKKKVRPDRVQLFLFGLFLVNAFIIYAYSLLKSPVFQFSVLLFCTPCLVLALAACWKNMPKKMFHLGALLSLSAILYTLVFQKHYFEQGLRQDFEEEVRVTVEWKQKVGKAAVDAIYRAEPYFVYFYQKKYKRPFPYKLYTDTVFATPASTRRYLAGLHSDILVVGNIDVSLHRLIREYYPCLLQHEESYFMNYSVYARQGAACLPVPEEAVYTFDQPTPFVPDAGRLRRVGQEPVLVIAPETQFPLAMKAPLDKLPLREGQFLQVEMQVQPDSTVKELLLALSVNAGDSALFYTATDLSRYASPDSARQPFMAYATMYLGSGLQSWKGADLACFFWNTGQGRYTISKFRISVIDYNPRRWIFWR